MKCANCGFDDKAPIGKSLENAKKGHNVKIKLNKNGEKMIVHNVLCRGLKL